LGRGEYIRFLVFSRASAREPRGRYERLKQWLGPELINTRVALADEVISILTKTISTLQQQLHNERSSGTSYLKEDPEICPSGDIFFPRHPTLDTLDSHDPR